MYTCSGAFRQFRFVGAWESISLSFSHGSSKGFSYSCPQDQTLPERSNNPFVILPSGASALLKALIHFDIEHSGDWVHLNHNAW